MRTTLDLPEELINEAMKATRIQTKTRVIITALEELIRKSKISEIKQKLLLLYHPPFAWPAKGHIESVGSTSFRHYRQRP